MSEGSKKHLFSLQIKNFQKVDFDKGLITEDIKSRINKWSVSPCNVNLRNQIENLLLSIASLI